MNPWDWKGADGLPGVLLDLARGSDEGGRVGVVGLAKNCGKTTTLNALLRAAATRNIRTGVTSGGRDGELYDAITGLPKPAIHLHPGALVALADYTIGSTSCQLEILQRTGIHTPAGEIVVAEALGPGFVEIFGCNRGDDLARAVRELRRVGAELVLVDGAAGRTFLANPDVVGSFVIATGAAMDTDIDSAAAETMHALHVFTLPWPEEALRARAMSLVQRGMSAVVEPEGSVRTLPWATLLGREEELTEGLGPDDVALICARAVGDRLLETLGLWLARRRRQRPQARFEVIAADPSKIAAGSQTVCRFEDAGGALKVLKRARVIAITCNPSSPSGAGYDPMDFVRRVSEVVDNLPVFDLVAGLAGLGGVVFEA